MLLKKLKWQSLLLVLLDARRGPENTPSVDMVRESFFSFFLSFTNIYRGLNSKPAKFFVNFCAVS